MSSPVEEEPKNVYQIAYFLDRSNHFDESWVLNQGNLTQVVNSTSLPEHKRFSTKRKSRASQATQKTIYDSLGIESVYDLLEAEEPGPDVPEGQYWAIHNL